MKKPTGMLRVKDKGFFTTIQDTGRFGYRDKGVPVSGAMDKYAAYVANSLLENEESAAVMEIVMKGPVLEFEAPTYIALSGAEMSAKLNDDSIQNYKVLKVNKGDQLSFGKLLSGFRTYLAVKEGFQTEIVLGSRSFYKPITIMNRIKEHMGISYLSCTEYEPKITDIKPESYHSEKILTVTRGPEYDSLTDAQLETLFFKNFTVAKENNRMAYQLEEPLREHHMSMLTSATLPGTVQLTPGGKLIVLMRDGQTTGGYPRILQLSSRAITILSQKKFGDKISFVLE